MNKVKFATMFNPQPTKPSEAGSEIYKWEYLDQITGEIKTDESNVYEKIQSYLRQTDFKERIKRGEEVSDAEGTYMDVSELGNDYNSLNTYIANLVKNIQQDIQKQKSNDPVTENSQPSEEASGKSQQTETEGGSKE